jgi:hypothetical protein
MRLDATRADAQAIGHFMTGPSSSRRRAKTCKNASSAILLLYCRAFPGGMNSVLIPGAVGVTSHKRAHSGCEGEIERESPGRAHRAHVVA